MSEYYARTDYTYDGSTDRLDRWGNINKPVEYELSYPWQSLTELTYGVRIPEMICIGAGTGMDKTEFLKNLKLIFCSSIKPT